MGDLTSYVYFKLIYDYLNQDIHDFGRELMGRTSTWASAIALTLVTLWIFFQGFRIVSGQSREPMMASVLHMGRIAVIVSAASTMTVTGFNLHTFLTVDLDKEIHGLFTGKSNRSTADAIDENLAWTQLALSTISAVQVIPNDAEMLSTKQRTAWFAAFGSASPPMAAAAMLLLYQFAIALFIGLGPIFILCLIFDQTKDLFRKWLLYGIGTIFSMALLSVVSSMVLGLTLRVSAAMWGEKIVNKILGTDAEGLTNTAMQQGGIGLLLTVLIVSVPPMAAMFFQGTLGSFTSHNPFGAEGKSRSGGDANAARSPAAGQHSDAAATGLSDSVFGPGGSPQRMTGVQPPVQADEIKTGSVSTRHT
ncbi:type IV secretion system protein [Luteibacter sp. PPL201]|uniref:Type IV secretion system protein n=1 Tax=Luteibacter sahnii TaxID=3021977 RepID=A0ABT6B9E9_9GAMM